MQDERTEPSRPSWRRKVSPSAQPERPGHEWTKRRLKPSGKGKLPKSGGFRVAGAVVGFLTCLVAVVVLIIMIQPPQPAAVVLVGADYADNLLVPHNVPGWQGIVGIEKVSRTPPPWSFFTPAALQLIRPPQVLDQADEWDRLIEDLRKTGFRQQTILFVVELHGISQPDGAYLAPNKLARPEEPTERLDLVHVIKTMSRLPAEKSKILVLEGAQIPANWRLGMLHNDFPRRLEELEPEILKVPNLWVLSACDVDQRCWSSEGLGGTVFSHYIIEALRGKMGRGDRTLTLDALYGYLRKSVRDWAWNARHAIQEPVLLPRAGQVRESGAEAEGAAKGEAARKLVRRSAKTVFLASVENAPDPEPPPSPDLEELSEAWKKFHNLDALVPHPAIYSPRRWSQFKAELVRYEELHRSGAAAKAVSVRGRIDALDSALNHERLLKLRGSAENTLPIIAVAGGRVEPPPIASRDSFLRFWEAPRDEALRIWDSLRTSEASTAETPSMRIRLDEFLLQRAVQDSIRNLQPVAEKLMITHKGSDYPQPAEVHFLRMLARWFRSRSQRPPELGGLIGQSLAVRMLAERAVLGLSATEGGRAYSYSEQILPWIKSLIEKGDEQRRQGEDLLFASERTAWARSEQAFNQAEPMYKDAVRRAVTIRAAFATRDHAMDVLPDYSRWLAHRSSEELYDDLTSRVEELWDTTHQLTARLEKPEVESDLGPLARFSRSLTQGWDHLTQRFQTARSKEDWEAATAAAAVPFPDKADLALRNALWVRLDNIRLRDQEVADPRNAQSVNLSDDDRNNEAKRVRRRAQIQGLMSLATLGDSWFDDPGVFKGLGLGDFASTMKKVRRAHENDEERAGTSWKDLADAGDLVGRRWRAMEPQIDRLVSEEGAMTDFRGFQDRLTKADRLGRQIDGSAPRLEESAHEAAARLRETRVHDFLLAMAERAWLDHWYDEDPRPPTPPYYKAAGSKLIDDASKLCDRSPLVRSTQERLNQKGLLEIEGLGSVVLTSEPGAGLKYQVVAKGTVPPGIPVVKPVPDRLLELEGESPGFRSVSMASGSDATVEFTVLSPLIRRAETDPKLNRPKVELTSLKVEGWFRGQPLARTTEVHLHPVPDTVAIGPLPADPPDASIAVRASKEIIRRFGAGTGSIAIVLDCSGSMLDRTPSGRTKFDEAKKALADVLALVPQGTTVSLWTFSQLPEGVNQIFEGDPIAAEPERTIRPLRRPAAWDPNQIDELVKKLNQVRPWLETPLVQAMWAAAKEDLSEAKGLKTLLVLTDGMDNRFAANRKFNPDNLSIPAFFTRYFKPLGIGVNMIFFTPAADKKQIATARADFTPALKGLEPPGNFVTADNLDQLIESLTRAIKQKLTCEILKPDLTPVGEEPLEVTGPGDADKWWSRGLAPRIYRLRVHAGKSYTQDIDLKEGDRIVVDLVDGPGGGIAFQRALYSDGEDFQDRIKAEQGGWRLAVRANRRSRQEGEERLQMLAALERKPDKGGTERLQQVRPRLAWFRLQAQEYEHSEEAFSVRWHERIFYPGPVWQFDVPHWVDDLGGEGLAKPILKAWWRDPETKLLPAGVIHLDPPGVVKDLPREIQVEGDKTVRIESLGVEEHYIEDRLGEPLQLKSCLVVRLAFPKSSPYLVDPGAINGVQTVGYEHRLYSQAGKYTGLFWPVNKPQIQTLSSLSLIALDAFRDEAEQQKNAVEIKLSRPRIEDQIPDPPDALPNGK